MKKVLIVGAGGFGREVLAWSHSCIGYGSEWSIAGFLDDAPESLVSYDTHIPILGSITDYRPNPNEELICAIGSPNAKHSVIEKLRSVGSVFKQLIASTAVLGDRVVLGQGVVVCPGVVITADVSLGEFVMVNYNSTLGHDVSIGSFSTISGQCDITGYCIVGHGVFLGSGARIVPRVKVGNRAFVSAGSVVVRDVAAEARVAGNPARPIPV
jgi:sugar O-acyltransferase (sialic acid O-acetyltransferase NeuD family)